MYCSAESNILLHFDPDFWSAVTPRKIRQMHISPTEIKSYHQAAVDADRALTAKGFFRAKQDEGVAVWIGWDEVRRALPREGAPVEWLCDDGVICELECS